MENTQETRKWPDLRGQAVVTLADGKKAGTCDDFYFDPATQQVYALRAKTGLFGHKVLLVTDINGIGEDAITTANEDRLRKESEDKRLSKLILGQDLLSYRVMSASGTLLGTIGNVLLATGTPTTLRLTAFELSGGLREHLSRRYLTFPAEQVVSYGADVLVIPDEVARSLQ